jgi:2-polyprenyl-3-methyl-5-hydroxy-6-metoxy-1,4-benzoquinol methylase
MFRHIAKSWSNYGETDAHYSVLTSERFRKETLEENLEEFQRSGTSQVHSFRNALARNGLVLPEGGTCVELGCGVGRITRWLAPLFRKVIALDVSPGHLALAKEYVGGHADNVEFRQLRRIEDLEQLPPVDVFYTFLVLQHNPPPVIEAILDRVFARLVSPSIAFVHLPTFIPDYHFDAEAYLAEREERLDMEMHMLPQKDVFRLIARHGLELLEVLNQTNELMMVADCILLRKA